MRKDAASRLMVMGAGLFFGLGFGGLIVEYTGVNIYTMYTSFLLLGLFLAVLSNQVDKKNK